MNVTKHKMVICDLRNILKAPKLTNCKIYTKMSLSLIKEFIYGFDGPYSLLTKRCRRKDYKGDKILCSVASQKFDYSISLVSPQLGDPLPTLYLCACKSCHFWLPESVVPVQLI